MTASLNLTADQKGQGNIAAVSTNIVMRVIVGYLSDKPACVRVPLVSVRSHGRVRLGRRRLGSARVD